MIKIIISDNGSTYLYKDNELKSYLSDYNSLLEVIMYNNIFSTPYIKNCIRYAVNGSSVTIYQLFPKTERGPIMYKRKDGSLVKVADSILAPQLLYITNFVVNELNEYIVSNIYIYSLMDCDVFLTNQFYTPKLPNIYSVSKICIGHDLNLKYNSDTIKFYDPNNIMFYTAFNSDLFSSFYIDDIYVDTPEKMFSMLDIKNQNDKCYNYVWFGTKTNFTLPK